MAQTNPVNTPEGKARRKLERQGKSDYEVAQALTAMWPDQRTMTCIVYSREHRTALTELAKELIKRGIAINYEYQSMEEVRSYESEDGRFNITIKDRTTNVPNALLKQISDKYGLVMLDCYDDDFSGEYEENPSADEMLAEHAKAWKTVEWLGGPDMDGDGAYDFYLTIPCPESPDGEDDSVTEKRVASNVRHLFARSVLESRDQLTLPKIRARPRTPPPVDMEVEYYEGDDEGYLSLSFPPDLSGPRVREMVFLLDALDNNYETLCKKRAGSRRKPNPAPTSNAALVGRLKF